MTNAAQITQRVARDGVPAPTVERDYVLAHVMVALGTMNDGHGLVIKGGTAVGKELHGGSSEDHGESALQFSITPGKLYTVTTLHKRSDI